MYINGIEPTGFSIKDYDGNIRQMGCPNSFADLIKQFETLKQAGATIGAMSFRVWPDDRRRKTSGPKTLHIDGDIDHLIDQATSGASLEKQQSERNRTKRRAA